MATKKKSKAYVLVPGAVLSSFNYYKEGGCRAFVDIGEHVLELRLGDDVVDPIGGVEAVLEQIAGVLKPYQEAS